MTHIKYGPVIQQNEFGQKERPTAFKHKGSHLQEELCGPSQSTFKDEAKERKMWWKTHSIFNLKYLTSATTDERLLLGVQQLRHALEIPGNSS